MRPLLLLALATMACGSSSETPSAPSDAGSTIDVAVAETSAADVADARRPSLLEDDFEAHALANWPDDSTHGAWRALYNGLGENAIKVDGSRVLSESPKPSTRLDETHACLVVSNAKLTGDLELTVRMKTVRQLRTPTPNPWEVAWIVWHYGDEGHFYYFAPKTNGWELAKVDASKKDPAGPACVWPEYLNCKYAGGQRYLLTGSTPTFPVGAWYRVRVRQLGTTMTVWVDDRELATFKDEETPYTSGSIGLYNEDANVHFDDVRVVSPE